MLALFLPVGVLLVAGLLTLSAISTHLFSLQLLWTATGVLVVVVLRFIDWRLILNYRWLIGALYVLSLLLLIFVLVHSPLIRNVKSWIVVGPLSFQPVELAKIALILSYAAYFSRRHLSIARMSILGASFALVAVPAFLTAIQPALGSAIILVGIWFGFLVSSGLSFRHGVMFAVLAVFAAAALWFYGLKPYQRDRVVGILYPERDVLGINYSTIQSKIAIGSAGVWGKGYGQGSQTQLGFLTEPESDFILAAFIEEWGWLLGLIVIFALVMLVIRILRIGAFAERNFEKFVCLGVAVVFSLQFILNAGSTTGLLPVVGITFPFFSYGGSNLLTSFLLLGIVHAIDVQA